MSDSTAALRHQIASAGELQGVVRTMRALAAASIRPYEQSVAALSEYTQAVELGLGAVLRQLDVDAAAAVEQPAAATGADARDTTHAAIVFGSDQGLVGPFNEVVVEHALLTLRALRGRCRVWVVGERAQSRLREAGLDVAGCRAVPAAVDGIAALVERLQLDTETHASHSAASTLWVFHNRPLSGALYEPAAQRLLPLDAAWRARLHARRWPTLLPPQTMGAAAATLRRLVREQLFITLFGACAESLASESASRLAAMERADRNIEDLLVALHGRLHQQRQAAIDGELFDVLAGYEALSPRGLPAG